MTEKEFRKLKALDLIQILLEQGNEATALKEDLERKDAWLEVLLGENDVIKAKLNDRDAMTELIKQKLNESDERIRGLESEVKGLYSDRIIELEEAGSLVQAALELNKIFEAAQKEAEIYIYNKERRLKGERYDALDMRENAAENVVGNMSGNLAGNMTGNVAGNAMGNTAGNRAGSMAGSFRERPQTVLPAQARQETVTQAQERPPLRTSYAAAPQYTREEAPSYRKEVTEPQYIREEAPPYRKEVTEPQYIRAEAPSYRKEVAELQYGKAAAAGTRFMSGAAYTQKQPRYVNESIAEEYSSYSEDIYAGERPGQLPEPPKEEEGPPGLEAFQWRVADEKPEPSAAESVKTNGWQARPQAEGQSRAQAERQTGPQAKQPARPQPEEIIPPWLETPLWQDTIPDSVTQDTAQPDINQSQNTTFTSEEPKQKSKGLFGFLRKKR